MASSGLACSSYDYSPVPLSPPATQRDLTNAETKPTHFGTKLVDLQEDSQDSTTQPPGWTSTYLRKPSLLSFAATFLTCLLAVIALAVVDATKDGIANGSSDEHYLWTYGPTAVLAVVAALWNQVEHRIKHAMPFFVLQKGPTPASETLLLDYVTPGKPEALLKALRRAHWPVVVAIANALLITLLTVASTGLFVLQETSLTQHNCRLELTDQFVDNFQTSKISSASVLASIAISNETIPLPPGTSRNAAFQSFGAPALLHGGLKNIEIDGTAAFFQAGLDCEAATIVSGPSGCSDRQCHGLNVSLTIASTTCNIKSYNLTTGCDMRPDAVICKLNETWGVGCDTHADGHGKNRLVFMNGYMKQDLHGADTNGTGPLEIFVHNTSTILCEPQYGLAETFVTVDQNGNIKNSPQLTTDTSRLEFPAWDLVDGLLTATTAAGTSLGQGYAYNSYDFFPWETLHDFFLKWVDVAYPLSDLTDQSVLQFRAEEWFSMTMAQMAKQSLMQPSTVSALGTCHGVQDRLRIRGLSLYLMGSILVLLIGFTIALLYIVPRRYSSRDSTSIGGLALAISQSPSLLARLSAYGSANLKTISRQLESTECETRLIRHDQGWQLAIDLTSNKVTEHPDAAPTEAETLYWQPLSLRSMFKVLVTACLVAIIVVLEILYSVSQKRNGLVKVDPTTDQRFAWAYIPAIVMVTIQTLVRMTAFSALMVFPYFQLRRQDTSTRQDVLRSYVSETAMKSLWQAVVAKHIVVFCMALATLLAPILTIAVSGLYTAVPTSEDIPITLSVHEQFNSSFRPIDLWFGVYGEMSMAASNDIGLLLTQNFTFPAWTYDEVALPKASMNLPNTLLPNSRALAGSNVTMRLPGIRSSLNCSLAPSAPTNFTNILGRNSANVTAFEVLDVDFLPWPRPGAQPFGFFTACGPSSSKDMHNTYCGAFGTSEVNWKAFTCGSRIDELDVDVALDAASLLVLAARPNESTARFFSNETLCSGLRDAFPSDMIPALFGGADFGGQKAYAGFYDPAFQAVVYGLGTRIRLEDFPMESYMNNEGASHIFDQLQHIHRILVAQSANLIRMPLNATSPLAPPATVTATLVNPHVYRLKQNAVSTRILDGLLVAIALCVAASFLMDTRKVLPKNPASIAAATSLIAAESRMLSKESLPEGAQWYSDTELKVKRVWDGAFFRLGWWDGDDPSEPESTLFKLDTL